MAANKGLAPVVMPPVGASQGGPMPRLALARPSTKTVRVAGSLSGFCYPSTHHRRFDPGGLQQFGGGRWTETVCGGAPAAGGGGKVARPWVHASLLGQNNTRCGCGSPTRWMPVIQQP